MQKLRKFPKDADDKEAALTSLGASFEQRAPSLVMLAADLAFASLRSEPRFQALLLRIGLPQ